VSRSAEIQKDAAFTANAAGAPAIPASTPPAAGPAIICRLKARLSSALAWDRRSAGTRRTTLDFPAGEARVASREARATSGSSAGSGGRAIAMTA
jgi:hypothetical protein